MQLYSEEVVSCQRITGVRFQYAAAVFVEVDFFFSQAVIEIQFEEA